MTVDGQEALFMTFDCKEDGPCLPKFLNTKGGFHGMDMFA